MTRTGSADTAAQVPWEGYRAGTPVYRRIITAMVAAGVATFAQLYAVQAVLPALAAAFDASAARVSLTVSLATGALAGFVLVWSGVADRFGRVPVMATALVVSTVLGALAPAAPTLGVLLALRAVQGAALGGLPAVAVAYLAEEVHPRYLGRVTGIYIAGNTLGGMSGRLVSGAVADFGGWRWGVGADAALGAVAVAVFLLAVPKARGFTARRRGAEGPGLGRRIVASVADPGLLALYAQGLFLMGSLVTVYNYLGFRLLGAPFGLSQTVVAFIFVAYLAGMAGSTLNGALVQRFSGGGGEGGDERGRRRMLWLAASGMLLGLLGLLAASLLVVVCALVLFTFSFFSAHATAAAWVGRRAVVARAQASALYTLCYYLGSSLFGWVGGLFYDHAGWGGMVGYVMALCCAALLSTIALRKPSS